MYLLCVRSGSEITIQPNVCVQASLASDTLFSSDIYKTVYT